MNIGARTLKKILANEVQQHMKKSYTMTKWYLFQANKDSSTYTSQSM